MSMTKFIIIMYLCSHIPGNACKPFEPEYTEFKNYHKCAIYGYEYSSDLMKNFSPEFVENYRPYTVFGCHEQSTT